MWRKDVGNGWEKFGIDMKIEIIKENLKKRTCKFIITGKEINGKLPVSISVFQLQQNHPVTVISLFHSTEKAFQFEICDDDCCDGHVSSFPKDETFIKENYEWVPDILYGNGGIVDEIELFKLKCEIFDKRKKLIPWIKDNLIKNQS